MLGWRSHSKVGQKAGWWGSMRQMPQELVGKVWSRRCMEPPMDGRGVEEMDVEAEVGQVHGGGHAGDTGADDEDRVVAVVSECVQHDIAMSSVETCLDRSPAA